MITNAKLDLNITFYDHQTDFCQFMKIWSTFYEFNILLFLWFDVLLLSNKQSVRDFIRSEKYVAICFRVFGINQLIR